MHLGKGGIMKTTMIVITLSLFVFFAVPLVSRGASQQFEKDLIHTSGGDLEITFIGHGTLMFFYSGKIIHVDPWSKLADYSTLPKADLILITHEHSDHLDLSAIAPIRTDKTELITTKTCAEKLTGAIVMNNGDVKTVQGFLVEAVPAYNVVHMRSEGNPYHPKGIGNGYIITFGDKKVYIAGDTENIPEMKQLKGIDIAFLPMNLPYTMTPEMVADAAMSFQPRLLYPYHFGETNVSKLQTLLQDQRGIEMRIRKMK
jgi:L-ascorbate metabolism protein UlaG (beta-lactamase superfamily)